MNEKLKLDLLKMSRMAFDILADEYNCNKDYISSFMDITLNGIMNETYTDEIELMEHIAKKMSSDTDFINKSKNQSVISIKDKDLLYYRILSILSDAYKMRNEVSKEDVDLIKDRLFNNDNITKVGKNTYAISSARASDMNFDEMSKNGSLCLPKMTMGFNDDILYIIEIVYDLEKIIPGYNDEDDEEDE